MDRRLNSILGDLSEIEQNLESMEHILETLDVAYELQGEKSARDCVLVFRAWAMSVKNKVAAAGDKLDTYNLNTKNENRKN